MVLFDTEVWCCLQSLRLRLAFVLQLDDLSSKESTIHALVLFLLFGLSDSVGQYWRCSLARSGWSVMDRASTAHPTDGSDFALLFRDALGSVPVAVERLDTSVVGLLVWVCSLLRVLCG